MNAIAISPNDLHRLHQVQFEMLCEFDRVAGLLGLRYQLAAGTLLGAVRHGGFIPWDDDVDLVMPRRDYERLLRLGPALLGREFFLQTHRSDPDFNLMFAKLRRNGSEFRELERAATPCHQGIFIDVFPFDAVTTQHWWGRLHLELVFLEKRLWHFSRRPWHRAPAGSRLSWKTALRRLAHAALSRLSERRWRRLRERVFTLLQWTSAESVTCLASTPESRPGLLARIRPVAELERCIRLRFEGRWFPAPKAFDVALTRLYGDYRQWPPPESRRPAHTIACLRFPDRDGGDATLGTCSSLGDSPMRASAAAADQLIGLWNTGSHGTALPEGLRPTSRAQGYAIQREWIARLGPVAGWKIAATSAAGQKHIAVSGPLVGPIFADRLGSSSAPVSLAGNRMRVAECELVFRFAQDLPARETPYDTDDVLAAVDGIGPGLEIPDSRFIDFEQAGEAQLIADCACSRDMVLGAFTAVRPDDLRLRQLASLRVQARVVACARSGAGERAFEGVGSNVLGDPLQALVWMVNELRSHAMAVRAGQFVTTGACVVPIPIQPGEHVQADFGWLGGLAARFA